MSLYIPMTLFISNLSEQSDPVQPEEGKQVSHRHKDAEPDSETAVHSEQLHQGTDQDSRTRGWQSGNRSRGNQRQDCQVRTGGK